MRRALRRAAALAGCVLLAGARDGRAANPAEALELPSVSVIATSPLPGLAVPLADVPANVQVYTGDELARQQGANVADFLIQSATGVSANAAQGNPFQPDLSFRGFSASPLLGTPEGLSVFQDGVRVNEPFGDIVNWDLIPQSAIADLQLIPGANPAFGLNTLGGALALYTKSGAQYPGGGVQLSGGSYGRRSAELDWGAARGPLDLFLTGNYFGERGWAEHNGSLVRQFFGKLGWQDERSELATALTLANNSLDGSQTLPLSFLDDPRQAYTFPDTNQDRLALLTVKGSHFLGDHALLGGNAYYRRSRNDSLSSNVNGDYGGTDPDSGVPDLVPAHNDRARIDERSYGGGLQLTLSARPPLPNQLTLGAGADLGVTHFAQQAQDAAFGPGRETIGTGPFVPLTTADSGSRYLGAFVADLLRLGEHLALSAAGRFNRAQLSITDLSGLAPRLDGTHLFNRFTPALGLSFNPSAQLGAYAGYSEGMRAPTAIELSCADVHAPCRLPNDFVADPPLAAVIARTAEAGARGSWRGWRWNTAVYQSRLSNDIEFISSAAGAGDTGYFANVGTTQRRGVELGIATRRAALTVSARYSLIEATFRDAFTASSPHNSSADAKGAIWVEPGDHLPGIPRQTLKLRLEYAPARWSVAVSVLGSTGVYARGDENNADRNGMLPGYVVTGLDAHYRVGAQWRLFARIDNLFNVSYENFGILGENFFTAPGNSFGPAAGVAPRAEQFRGPGAPRGLWLGVRWGLQGNEGGDGDGD